MSSDSEMSSVLNLQTTRRILMFHRRKGKTSKFCIANTRHIKMSHLQKMMKKKIKTKRLM